MTVRVGIIGLGHWATMNHVPAILANPRARIVACYDVQADHLARAVGVPGFPQDALLTTRYAEFLEASLDAVVVASPPRFHYEQSKDALQHGWHVLCEKPFTIRADHAWELAELSRSVGRHILIPYGWNYSSMAAQARQLFGEIGRLESFTVHFAAPLRALIETGHPGHGGGSFRRGDDVVGFNPSFPIDPRTYSDVAFAGGGFGQTNVTHALGLLVNLHPLHARRVVCRTVDTSPGMDLHMSMLLELGDGGIGAVTGSVSPETSERHQFDIRLYGEFGELLLDFERERVRLTSDRSGRVDVPCGPGDGIYDCTAPANVLIDLAEGMASPNQSDGYLAAEVVSLLEAAYLSAASGEWTAVNNGHGDP